LEGSTGSLIKTQSSSPVLSSGRVHQFMSSEMPAKLAGMGFKRASFVNDITFEEWSRKLE
jgi:hypothetical protein